MLRKLDIQPCTVLMNKMAPKPTGALPLMQWSWMQFHTPQVWLILTLCMLDDLIISSSCNPITGGGYPEMHNGHQNDAGNSYMNLINIETALDTGI